MGAAKWGREGEFRRLFQAQMKRMTRDGLDTLVYIAIKDMTECYKAVPALALHLMKKASKDGSARLHVIRIMDAIITKSRLKHKLSDKFVPRMESAKVAQALFEQMKECGAEQKAKAAKVLQAWRKNRVLSPPSQAATEDALGMDMLATSGDSAAVKAGGVSSNIISASDNETAADAHTKAVAAAVTADQAANVTVTSPLATSSKTATNVYNNSSDSGQKGTLDTSHLAGLTSQPDGSTAQPDTSKAPVQLARSSSEEMRRSLAQLSPGQPNMHAALASTYQDRPGAPPLPPDNVAPFDSGVDAVVLASGATLTNPQLEAGKPPRRSKFDRPASGGRENDSGAALATAADRFQPSRAQSANESSAAPPGLPMRADPGGVPGISPRASAHTRPTQALGEQQALPSESIRGAPAPGFQAPFAAAQVTTPPPSSAAVPSGGPASIEVQPPPSFGEVWNPAPNSLKSATPAQPPQGHSASAAPPPAPPTTAHHGSGSGAYDPMSAASAQAAPHHSPWPAAAAAASAHLQQPAGYQHMAMNGASGMSMMRAPAQAPPPGPPPAPSPQGGFPSGPPRGPQPVQLPPPRPPFQNCSRQSPVQGASAPYNPFVASSAAPHSQPHGGAPWQARGPDGVPPSQRPPGPTHKPPVLAPPDSDKATAPRGLPGPPPRAPAESQDGVAAPGPPGRVGSPRGLPPPPPGPPNSVENGHGSAVRANGTLDPQGFDKRASEDDLGAPRKRRRSRWDDDAA